MIRRPTRVGTFDTETSGVDVENDRIVTAFIGVLDTETGEFTESWSWLINPGVEIPQGAIDVHGVTNKRARAEGEDAREAIFSINQRLDILDRQALPLVIMNAPYDLTLLDRETRRHWAGMKTFNPRAGVLDPGVIDKRLDPFRKGKRRLVDLAAHYGVPVREDAHDAAADCWMAGNVILKQLEHKMFAKLDIRAIHERQISLKAEQASSFREYLKKQGKPFDDVRDEWPLIPYIEPEEEDPGF